MNSSFAEAVLPSLIGTSLPAPIERAIAKILGFDKLAEVYEGLRNAPDVLIALLRHIGAHCRISEHDLSRIPGNGSVMVVANHPTGLLDGAVLATVLRDVRSDVRILANELLFAVPELRDVIIGVDALGGTGAAVRNRRGVAEAIEHLTSGGALVVFPAGEVAHFQWRRGAIAESPWNARAVRIAAVAAERGTDMTVLPAFITGANSALFHAAGAIHPTARTALLVRELLNKRNRTVEVRIGAPVGSRKLMELSTDQARVEYLQWRTTLLGARQHFRTDTRVPVHLAPTQTGAPIAAPADPLEQKRETEALPPAARLAHSGDLAVYIAKAQQIPTVLQEIGRLREITFRAVGEGTGESTDLDRFDADYLHLFVWNHTRGEVVGAYRLAATDRVPALYTATLFRYQPEFIRRLGPALELGRSFVRVEYQRAFAPLLLLWKGIGKFLALNPQYKVLFGPVSITNQYSAPARDLMISFLERYASLPSLRDLVHPRKRLRARARDLSAVTHPLQVDDLATAVSDVEASEIGVPVLLRQYLKLGGKLLAFSVDRKFSNALDGLIVVDLTQTEPKLLERYLGKEEAVQFLAYQKGTYGAESNPDGRELGAPRHRGRNPAANPVFQVQRSA